MEKMCLNLVAQSKILTILFLVPNNNFFFFFHVSIGKQCKIILYVLLQFLHSPLLIWMRGVAITQTCTVFLHTVSSQHPYRLHRYTCVSMWIDFIFYLKYQTSITDCEVFGVCCCGVCFIMKMLYFLNFAYCLWD